MGDILGRVIFVCISNNVPADSCTSKAALRAALAPLEINYVNSCGWRDRIEGGKQTSLRSPMASLRERRVRLKLFWYHVVGAVKRITRSIGV